METGTARIQASQDKRGVADLVEALAVLSDQADDAAVEALRLGDADLRDECVRMSRVARERRDQYLKRGESLQRREISIV